VSCHSTWGEDDGCSRRYLGDDAPWDPRLRSYLQDDPAATGTEWLRIEPASVRATDLSFRVSRNLGGGSV
jgi:hypothetical protein